MSETTTLDRRPVRRQCLSRSPAAATSSYFPHMIVPLFVGREKSIKALEEVMSADKQILLATQKDASDGRSITGIDL